MLKGFYNADVLFISCVANTIGYCCFTTDVAYATVSCFLSSEKKTEKKEKKIPSAEIFLNKNFVI